MSGDPGDDARVGYGRPPKHTQFKKGQSGNRAGRPKGSRKLAEVPFPGIYPTRSILREEARRRVAVRDGEKRYEIPTTEAVVRSLAKQAMAGGVLAARTYLKYQAAEDERIAKEREDTFTFWRDYVVRERRLLDRARARGQLPPDPIPHPDDITFDYTDRTVRIDGPSDEATARAARIVCDLSHLLYELSIWHGDHWTVEEVTGEPTFSIWFAVFLQFQQLLPRRMRGICDEFDREVCDRLWLPRHRWAEYLEKRCAELNFRFASPKKPLPRLTLRDIGLDDQAGEAARLVRKILGDGKPVRYRARSGRPR